MEKTDKMVQHNRHFSETAELEGKGQYPYIDRGQLALVRGKPNEVKEQNKYIESAANLMIKTAGKKYESFIVG